MDQADGGAEEGLDNRCLADTTLPCIQVTIVWERILYVLRLVEWASGLTICLTVGVELEVSLSLIVLAINCANHGAYSDIGGL